MALRVYLFPLAAGINYHELSGSKPSQFVLLRLQKYEPSFTGLKVKRSAGPVPSRGPEGRICFLAFLVLGPVRVPQLPVPRSTFKERITRVSVSSCSRFSLLTDSSCSDHLTSQGPSLQQIYKALLSYKVTLTGVGD